VTEEEIQDEFRRQFEKANIEFIVLKASDLADTVDVSADDVASYYEHHKEEYKEPPLIKLAYVTLKKEPSEMDYADTKQVAESILDRARAGDVFSELAEKYSDDTATAAMGGDLGFFGKGKMVKAFEDVAFSLNPGEMSDPVRSPFGYHIIKVEETKGEGQQKQVRARHILLKVEPSDDTLLSLEEEAARLSLAAQKSSLEQAASEIKLSASVTPEFVETSGMIPGLGVVPEISEVLPGLKAGSTSDVIETRTAFFVVQVTERKPEHIPQLSEIEERVRAATRLDKALALARTRGEQIVQEANTKKLALRDIKNVPEVQKAEPFTRRGTPPEAPALSGQVAAVFQLSEGEAAGPFMSTDAAYVVQLKEKIAPDPAEYKARKESIEARLLMERRAQVFEDYYQNLKKHNNVRIDEQLLQAA
jgi:peptidyl-prolyl cis-trans isomerase D